MNTRGENGSSNLRATLTRLRRNIASVIQGKDQVIELVIAAVVARGHVLLEDVPGVGKTMLAKSLARSIRARFSRVQLTPDLLPSDITGTLIFNEQTSQFELREGPVFTHILLADELNRATPRTQSSLLEAMEERQVSVDGRTYPLPQPFFVIATQNPVEQEGVYPLPEAQLDRFLMKLSLGYPAREDEFRIVKIRLNDEPFTKLEPVADVSDIIAAQKECHDVYVDETVLSYALSVVEATRRHPDIVLGASPRATIALVTSAQAYAYVLGRTYVLPDDIKFLARPVLSHRLMLRPQAAISGRTAEDIIGEILQEVPVPLTLEEV